MSRKSGSASIKLSGLLNVREISKAKEALLELFKKDEEVCLDIGADTNADIAGIQVIIAARRYAHSKSKRISLAEPISGRALDVMKRGGFLEQMTEEERLFWLHEGN